MKEEQKKPKFDSLASKIAKAVDLGWKEGLTPQKPYAAFGYQRDPFVYFPPDDPTLVETPDLIAALQRIMGHFSDLYAKKGSITTPESFEGHHLLVLGPMDSGRTYLLEFAHHALNDYNVDNYGKLTTLYIDAEKEWKFTGKKSQKESNKKADVDNTSKYQRFTAWLSEHEETIRRVDIFYIDNVGSVTDIFEYIVSQIQDCGALPLLVGSLSIAEYEWIKKEGLEASLNYFSEIPFHLNSVQDTKLMVEILQKRLNTSNGKGSPFSNESLHTVADFVFGLPGLAMWLSSEVLTHTYNIREEKVTKEIVQHVAKRLGFDASKTLLESYSGPPPQQLILKYALHATGESRIKLGRGHNRDYAIIFGGGITNKKLQDTPIIGTRSKSTISHHLKALYENKNFLHVQKKGKSRIYFLERPILNALELINSKGQSSRPMIEKQVQE